MTMAMMLLTGLNVLAQSEIAPGYYLMKGTAVSTAADYYLRTTSSNLPHMVKVTMPETLTANEKCYIWKVGPMDGGALCIQNIVDNRYLGGQIGTYRHHGSMSQMPHAITFTPASSGDGTFKLNADLDQPSGYGTAMRPGWGGENVFLWYCDNQQGEQPAWAFEPVDADIVDQLLQEKMTYSGIDIEEGYYYVRADLGNSSKPGAYLCGNTSDMYRMYQDQCEELSTTDISEETVKYIFSVKKIDGGYAFKNIGIDRYLGGSPNGNGHHVGAVFHATPLVVGNGDKEGTYTILDEQQPCNGFLPAYLNSGNEAFAWWAGSAAWLTSSINWNLIKLDTETVENAVPHIITAVGTLTNAYWDAESYDYMLEHKGGNVYVGEISVDDEADGYGFFSIYSRISEDSKPSIYSGNAAGIELFYGVTDACGIYNEGFTWKVPAGTHLVTFDLQNSTIRLNDPADPDFVQSRAYAELAAAIEKVEEEWPDLDLSGVKAILADKSSTDEQLEAATASIPGLIRAYIYANMEKEATGANPYEATALIINPTCDSRTGWSGTVLNYANHNMNAGKADFDVYQRLANLPNGLYGVSVYNASATGKAVIYTQSSGVKNYVHSVVGTEETMEDRLVLAYVNDGMLTIGASCQNNGAGDQFVCDDWTLLYFGNQPDIMDAIKDNLSDVYSEIEDLICSKTAKQGYIAAYDALTDVSDMQKASELFVALADANTAVDNSCKAYATYQAAVADVRASLEKNAGISGAGVDKLKGYLDTTVEPGDVYPNGSFLYIIANGNIDTEDGLQAEALYAIQLLEEALRGGIVEGAIIDDLFANLKFEEPSFTGWTEEHEGPGTCSGKHGDGKNNVAGWHNMNKVSMTQTVDGLPDGIYAVSFNGFFRTGGVSNSSSSDLMSAFFMVGNTRTPMTNIWDGALSEMEAQEGINCAADDYSDGEIRIPNMPDGAATALGSGRYAQTAYGTAVDGKLTIGVCVDSFPEYRNSWLIIDNISIRYMGKAEATAEAMAEAQAERAATITSSIYCCAGTIREAIYETIGSDAGTAEENIAKANKLNSLCNDFMQSAVIFTELETKTIDFSQVIQNAFDGQRISQEEYDGYFELYTTSLGGVYEGLFSNQEAIDMMARLDEIVEKLTPRIVDGYYYMAATEVSTADGRYLYASSSDLPHMVNFEKSEAPTVADKGFIWHVRLLEDGKLSIQSIADHRFLGGQVGVHAHYGTLSPDPIAITPTYFGTYNDGSATTTDAWKLNAATRRDSGFGTALRPGTGTEALLLWYCDNQRGEAPAWRFEPVDNELAAVLEHTVAPYEGDDIEEGFYYVRSALTNPNKPGAYIYNNGGSLYDTMLDVRKDELSTTNVTAREEDYLWYIGKEQDGYTFLNVGTRRYMAGSKNHNGHLVGTSLHPAAMTILKDEASGNYIIEDKSQRENAYLPAYLNSGNEQTAWWTGTDTFLPNCYWTLIPVTGYDDPDALQRIVATDAVNATPQDGIYTISGQKVGSQKLSDGLYIIVTDGKARKVMIK